MNKYDLRGIKSLWAFQTMHTLLLGCYMIPMFSEKKETFEEFLERFEKGTEEEQRNTLKRAICLVELKKDEILAVCGFAKDKNGIPYTAENINNLTFAEIADIVVDVCCEIAKIKVFF